MQARVLFFSIFLATNPVWAQTEKPSTFYEPGFAYQLNKSDANLSITDAAGLGSMVLVQIGGQHISAVNTDTALERWRFTSRTGSIRRMVLKGATLLVEAEQLYALNTATGQQQWQFPLNCFSATSCNSRIRHWDADVVVLSGFDGKDDQLMLVNPKTGARLWPTWVEVPTARL